MLLPEIGSCPECGSKMCLMLSKSEPFLGCVRYPACRATREPTADELQWIERRLVHWPGSGPIERPFAPASPNRDLPTRIAELRPHASHLLALSSEPWTLDNFVRACGTFGWEYRPQQRIAGLSPTDHVFVLTQDLRLEVVFEPVPSKFPSRRLWGYYGHVLVDYHEVSNFEEVAGEVIDRGADDFDRAFHLSMDALVCELGSPDVMGTHSQGQYARNLTTGEVRLHFGIWRGERGLLVLQQGELDLQCGGPDLSLCIHPWEAGRPTPQSPILAFDPRHY